MNEKKNILASLLFLMFLPAILFAAEGDLDTSFSGAGYALYNSEPDTGAYGDDYSFAVAIQLDGKIVVAGYRNYDFNDDVLVLRYKMDGTLDSAFGTGGVVLYDGGHGDQAYGVVVQPDGKIVVVGYRNNGTNQDVLMLRYDSTGALDSTFGTGGVFTYNGSGNGDDVANGVAIQSDGKIVVVGYTDNGTDTDVLLMRLDKNGALDSTFGTGGVMTYDRYIYDDDVNGFHFNEGSLVGQAVAIQGTDGSFFVLGSGGSLVFVMKYDSGGSPVASFGMGGVTKPYVGVADPPGGGIGAGAHGLALQSDGKILVGGDKGVAGSDVVVLRYKTDGTLDTGFGVAGEATYEGSTHYDFGYGVAVQSDGKILLAGSIAEALHGGQSSYDVLVLRFDSSGNLDGTFGTGGVVKVNGPSDYSEDDGRAIVLHSTGKIIVAGRTANWDLGAENRTWDVFVVSLEGSAQPDIEISPASPINMGTVYVGSFFDQPVEVRNVGSADLVFGIIGALSSPFSFRPGGTCTNGMTITPGSSCTINVRFAPTSVAIYTGGFTIPSNDADENPVQVQLNGIGLEPPSQPDIDVSPESHNFGSVNVGSSITQAFIISNTGVADLTFSFPVYVTGGDEGMFNIATGGVNPCASLKPTIPAGGNCTVVATFSPTSVGEKSSTLRFQSNDLDEATKDVILNGTGEAVTALQDIDVIPSPVPFGSVNLGGSIQRQITISNTGGSDLWVSNLTITGVDTGMFTVASGGTNPCGDVVLKIIPGDSCTLITTFTPGSEGLKTATLRIMSDDPDENQKDVTLNGTGVLSDHGKLDTSFSGAGYALYNSEPDTGAYGEDYGNAVAIQPDGKIVVVGDRIFDFNVDVLILRYKIDGTLDDSFGTGGVVTYDGGHGDLAYGVGLQSDGKIVVVGYTDSDTNRDVLVLRYTTQGVLDSTFGTGGVFIYSGTGNGDDEANGVVIQSDGKIVVVGYTDNGTDTDVLLMRLDKNGALDSTFGTGGVVTYDHYIYEDPPNLIDIDEPNLVGQAVVIQDSDGSVFVLGGPSVYILKYNNEGSLVTTFGVNGVTKPYVGSVDIPGAGIGAGGHGLALQSDGKILVGGEKGVAGSDVVVLRYKTDGALDPSFGTGGEATYEGSIGGHDFGYGVAVQSDGKILLAGSISDVPHGSGYNYDVLVLRFDSSGNLDGTFGTGGVVKVNGPSDYSEDDGRAIALHPAGKIIVVGTTADWDLGAENRTWDVFVVSLEGPPQPDIDISPPSHDFGGVNVNNSAQQTFTISNTGGSNLIVTSPIGITGIDSAMFGVSVGGMNPCTSLSPAIPAGGSCTIMVTFTPTTIGNKSGNLNIPSNDPDTPNLIVALSGNGTQPSVAGDCNGNGETSIDEVQRCINQYLGILAVESCNDLNGDQQVTIDEVQSVINAFLEI